MEEVKPNPLIFSLEFSLLPASGSKRELSASVLVAIRARLLPCSLVMETDSPQEPEPIKPFLLYVALVVVFHRVLVEQSCP